MLLCIPEREQTTRGNIPSPFVRIPFELGRVLLPPLTTLSNSQLQPKYHYNTFPLLKISKSLSISFHFQIIFTLILLFNIQLKQSDIEKTINMVKKISVAQFKYFRRVLINFAQDII